jgi:hypothetical protein
MTLEVSKRDDVVFHLTPDEEGQVVGGDQFLTVVFVRSLNGSMESWLPWEEG